MCQEESVFPDSLIVLFLLHREEISDFQPRSIHLCLLWVSLSELSLFPGALFTFARSVKDTYFPICLHIFFRQKKDEKGPFCAPGLHFLICIPLPNHRPLFLYVQSFPVTAICVPKVQEEMGQRKCGTVRFPNLISFSSFSSSLFRFCCWASSFPPFFLE